MITMTLKSIYIGTYTFVSVLLNTGFGQSTEHESHHHADSEYELGISFGLSHLTDEGENALGSHIHLLRRLGSEELSEKIALGLGFEYIFTEHPHYSLVGTVSINPIWALIFDISPGILITEHEGSKEKQFVTHLELTYEFEYRNFGIGPVIGLGLSEDDNHYMFGIHIGKGF